MPRRRWLPASLPLLLPDDVSKHLTWEPEDDDASHIFEALEGAHARPEALKITSPVSR